MNEMIQDNNWFMWGLSQPWFTWGVALLFIFPLLIVLLGEIKDKLGSIGSPFEKVVKNFRHQVLPQLVLLLLLTKVFELDSTSTAVRLVETLLYIFLIHASLAFVDTLLFSDRHTTGWRAKVPKLVLDIARAFLVLMGTAIVLSNVWGFELGRLLTALGVGSVVLGLALQDTLGSLFSGFALLSSRQFRVDDWLAVGDIEGKIITMNWRTVTLLTRDQDIIIVPNSELAKSNFLNYSYPYPLHMERIQFDFSFDDAPHKVKAALLEAVRETPGILSDPPPNVALLSYDEFSIKHEVQFFIEHYTDQPRIKDLYMSRIWYLAKRHGITFPTRAHEVFHYNPEKAAVVPEEDKAMETLDKTIFIEDNPKITREMSLNSTALEFGTSEVIVHQNAISDTLYIVHEGVGREEFVDTNGKVHVINEFTEGEFFGLSSLVRNEPNATSIVASIDTIVLAVDQDTVHNLLENHPDFTAHIEELIARRDRTLSNIQRKFPINLVATNKKTTILEPENKKVLHLKKFLQR